MAILKICRWMALTVGMSSSWLAGAASPPAEQPVLIAESELFEVVGRLDEQTLILWLDRAPSNAPVLDAKLELERDGQATQAVFNPATGDYRIDDATWLAPLRQPGRHALSLTVLAGDEADLLSADMVLAAASTVNEATAWPRWSAWLLGILLLAGVWRWHAGRQGEAA
ncbi:MAG: hypothetical protein PHV02_04665 [Rhodocyclaceae bacterium]|nr:hypothetical protein [Rhodocyclaceae bacterium]